MTGEGSPLLPDGTLPTGNRAYDALPRPIKDLHPYESWLWMADADKGTLIQTETEPDY